MAWSYKVGGEEVTLEVDPGLVAVQFRGQPLRSERAAIAETAGTGPYARRIEIPGEKLTVVPVSASSNGINGKDAPAAMQSALHSLNANDSVAQANPVFRVGSNRVVATDRIVIGLDDPNASASIVEAHKLTILRMRDDKLICEIPEGAEIFAIVAAVDRMPGVRYAEPDFVTIGRHLPKRADADGATVLNVAAVHDQYALRLTGARDAWKLQAGKPEISVAVLDEGVDSAHPDLSRAVVKKYDATDGDSYQEPNPWDGHGTCCAGLAAADGTDGSGVRGIGAGCALHAVRIAFARFPNGDWVTTNEVIADAIDWSWRNGADVLSNSWGGGPKSNSIAEAFEAARTRGRNGRGCVVVVAAGNEFGPVSFPGSLPRVLTVSASNEFDQAKTPTSSDGETWWGTNHGREIDVAAPGVHNVTTDIQGAAGYDASSYVNNFNGTSSATPLVAGACALVLCANPDLGESEVRQIIAETADRVGQLPYVDGRNDFFGSGRLNVLRAVQRAQATSPAA